MSDGFYWLKPRNIYGISQALKQTDSFAEREQLRKLMYRGILEWSFIIAFFAALIIGGMVIEDSTGVLIASK
ncbi:MAG: hypothetical protein ACRBBN_01055 [Methyloligellaceae bacterium]